MLKNGTFTPSSTDAAMILTATNQRCCNELFDLHLSDVSCCFEVGKHPLGVLAAAGSDESTSGAICITLRAAHAACCADRPRDTDKRAFVLRHRDCNHQFWKQPVTNVTDIYVRNPKEKQSLDGHPASGRIRGIGAGWGARARAARAQNVSSVGKANV